MLISTIAKTLVSIGIPTYNRPDGLRRTLESITGQTYANLEIVISDNASTTPETKQVIDEYQMKDSRIRCYRQENNIGAFCNFKFVLDKSTGEYFMWAADDDEWKPEFVESCVELFDNKTALVCSRMEIVWRRSGRKEDIKLPDIRSSASAFQRVSSFFICAAPSMIYGLHRRSNLNDLNAFEDVFDFYDCALLIRILSQSGVKISDNKMYVAGIDAEEYQVKPRKSSAESRLKYLPFLSYSAKSLINIEVSNKQRIILLLMLVQFSSNNYIFQESDFNQEPISRKLKLLFIRNFNSIVNVLINLLSPGDTDAK